MRFNSQRFDTTLLGPVLVGALLAGTFACFGIAVAAHTASSSDATAEVISVTAALRQMEAPRAKNEPIYDGTTTIILANRTR